MHWIVGVVGNHYFVAKEIDIYKKTGAKYDPCDAEAYVSYWYEFSYFTKERAMRLVDILFYKTPLTQTNGNPWDYYPKQQRKQIDSWEMESLLK